MLLPGLQVYAKGQEAKPESPQLKVYEVKGVKFTMVTVEGGTFLMGDDSGRYGEQPAHKVKLRRFSIGQTEVTQELWEAGKP